MARSEEEAGAVREFILKDCNDAGPFRLLREPRDAPSVVSRRNEESEESPERAPDPPPPSPPARWEPPSCEAPAEPPDLKAPAEPPDHEAPARPKRPSASVPRKRGERVFVVKYDSQYLGLFEAEEELNPREAFVWVARELASREAFDPTRLTLFRLVLLRGARAPKGTKLVRGRLARVERELDLLNPPGRGEPEGAEEPNSDEVSPRQRRDGSPREPLVLLEEPVQADATP